MKEEARTLLRVAELTHHYGWSAVLRGVSFQVARGESVAILGANGSGKTTLLRLLAGLLLASEGSIQIGGWEIPREAAAVRAQVGYLGHEGMQDAQLSAAENLQFFARCYRLPSQRGLEMLSRVGLDDYAAVPVYQLSRGRQQLLNIARCLLHEPDLLLLDEPMSNLDADAQERLCNLIVETRRRGGAIIWATHDLTRAAAEASRAFILRGGRLVWDSAKDAKGRDWAKVAREFLLGSR